MRTSGDVEGHGRSGGWPGPNESRRIRHRRCRHVSALARRGPRRRAASEVSHCQVSWAARVGAQLARASRPRTPRNRRTPRPSPSVEGRAASGAICSRARWSPTRRARAYLRGIGHAVRRARGAARHTGRASCCGERRSAARAMRGRGRERRDGTGDDLAGRTCGSLATRSLNGAISDFLDRSLGRNASRRGSGAGRDARVPSSSAPGDVSATFLGVVRISCAPSTPAPPR